MGPDFSRIVVRVADEKDGCGTNQTCDSDGLRSPRRTDLCGRVSENHGDSIGKARNLRDEVKHPPTSLDYSCEAVGVKGPPAYSPRRIGRSLAARGESGRPDAVLVG